MNLKHLVLAVGVTLSTLALNASAALPASVGSTITAVQADMQSMFDLIFPVVAVGVGLTIAIKLFKRFTSKV